MHIWEFHDFFFAALWALLAAGIHRLTKYLKTQIETDDTISDREAKYFRYGLLVLRWMVYLAVAFSVGTIALPLLDALLSALIGTASDLFNKYGGLLLLVVVAILLWKNRKTKPDDTGGGGIDPVEVEYAEQEAAELHDDLGELLYNAVVDTSENTPITRPRDAASIETGKEKPYRSDGIMMIHQFSIDTETPLDRAGEDLALRELQRHTNQRAKRYPQLCRDGLPPVIYDIKNNGNFIILEVVLYSEKYKSKIEARRKARIARQQRQDEGDAGDPLFR